MSGGRPRTAIGTYGAISVCTNRRKTRRTYTAKTRFRDLDGGLRPVEATAGSDTAARAALKEKLLKRTGYGGGVLDPSSPFTALEKLWRDDLELRKINDGTKHNYLEDLRLHVRPAFEHYTLGEMTTGRVELFLQREAAVSYSRAKHSRTMLNLLFNFALRHDAIPRNPVEGTSPLARPKGAPQALTLEQIAAIRLAANTWRTGKGVKGPKPDGKVRDIFEILLGTSLRIGELLALRPVDVVSTRKGMIVHVRGTVVIRKGRGVFRQSHAKTPTSIRRIPVAPFAARVLQERLAEMGPDEAERTIFASRKGTPLSPFNVRRTFREFLVLAKLKESGITLRWTRRTGATVLARGMSVGVAATYLGHASSAITEGYYIEPDEKVDLTPAEHLDRTLRPEGADGSLLELPGSELEEDELDEIDDIDEDDDGDEQASAAA
ncbi:tyrosine-type recombinase/integrase [Promicromonospora sp. NPDC023987]|uniref:tyrosine-type recombinase/integrase n=1 Tax=Promicromonospora sp. NPDC023987 TaxID=3155360 RepID=UPI0033FD77C7